MCVPCSCFLRGLYRADSTVIIFLVIMIALQKSSLDRTINVVIVAHIGQSHLVRATNWCPLLTVVPKSRIV